jgi:hypothetical protein
MSMRAKVGSKMAILLATLLVIAIIQVLPQVSLPETAFHGDSAPTVAKSRFIAASSLVVLLPKTGFILLASVRPGASDFLASVVHPVHESRSILFSALLC